MSEPPANEADPRRHGDRPTSRGSVDSRRLLDHLQVGLIIVTGAGHIVDMNRYARLMLKQDTSMEGLLVDEVLPAAISAELAGLAGRMRKALNGSAKRTVAVATDSGPAHWEVTVSRSAAEGDHDIQIIMLDDVTEIVEYERLQRRTERLERLNLAAREANRLKTEFLANMSHELRTPLNSIIGFTELMQGGKVGTPLPQHREFLDDILTSARHLLQIINDVLDLSKVEAGKMDFHPEPVHMPSLVDEVTGILREQAARKQIHIIRDITRDAEDACIDPLRVKQILYNYLSNAVKFTGTGDEVRVRVCTREDRLRLEVHDNGPGIPEHERHRLFSEFEQLDQGADKNHQGTGLGLALTRRLAEAQGGTVGVESVPGAGSTFWAELPQGDAAHAAADAARERQIRPIGPIDPSARVLVVEDDAAQREQIVSALERVGYQVDTAATAREAHRKVTERAYDAITLDLLLPDGHGEDVLRALRSQGAQRGTPVIVASVVEMQGEVLGFPVVDFLVKPFDAEALIDALRRAGVTPERPILIIDDDPAVQRLVGHHLQDMGYVVRHAADGREGLRLAEATPPGLVVLDLLMPEIDGFGFLERFRATPAGATTPVIVWTTKELTHDERVFLQHAAHKVLQKGEGGTHTLVAALQRALGTHQHKRRSHVTVTP